MLSPGNIFGVVFNGAHMRRIMVQAGKSPTPVISAKNEHVLALQLFCNRQDALLVARILRCQILLVIAQPTIFGKTIGFLKENQLSFQGRQFMRQSPQEEHTAICSRSCYNLPA